MAQGRPASRKVSAAFSPAMPAPTIAIRIMLLLLWGFIRTGWPADIQARSLFLVVCVLLRLLDGHIGHGIPRVMDADEQEQNRHYRDAKQVWLREGRE